MVIPLFGISKVVISDLWISFLSSDATCAVIASFVLLYPSASATSLPTNHTTPSISTVLSSPNCGWLNTVGASVGVDASGRWAVRETCHHYAPSSNDVYLWHTLIRHEGRMLIPFARRARCQCFPFTVVGEWEITNFLTSKKFIKYCWLYSSISFRNQSLFLAEHFPSYARKITPLAVYSIRPTISPATTPLYSRIFSALLL